MTHLARTIPPGQITLGQGELVFPHLYTELEQRSLTTLLKVMQAREEFGTEKHGQPLMTGDERDTATEIVNEVADLLAYQQKWVLQNPTDYVAQGLLSRTIVFAAELLEHYGGER